INPFSENIRVGKLSNGSGNTDDYLFAVAQQRLERRGDRNPISVTQFNHHLFTTPIKIECVMRKFLIILFSSFSLTACRSEEHTSELQSRFDLVCRLLLEK